MRGRETEMREKEGQKQCGFREISFKNVRNYAILRLITVRNVCAWATVRSWKIPEKIRRELRLFARICVYLRLFAGNLFIFIF